MAPSIEALELPKASPKQNEENTTKLIEAKDRAQVAATTAMSIAHVALLRTLLHGGPTAHKYYIAVLVLIILSLILQVTAGLLSLALFHMKSYFQKHKESACSVMVDAVRHCCSFDIRDSVKAKTRVQAASNTGRDGTTRRQEAWQCPVLNADDIDSLEKACDECLAAQLKSDLQVVKAEVNLRYVNCLRDNTTRGDAETHDKDYIDIKRDNLIIHKQRDILVSQYDESMKKDILKKIGFWQHLLNYILYFVFILNIFITAFGVSPSLRNEVGNATNSATP